MGPAIPGAIVAINKLIEEGHEIYIFTGRDVQIDRVKQAVIDWLNYFGIAVHGITNIKDPSWDVMLDDRGLRFTDWTKALGDLKKIESHLAPYIVNDNNPHNPLFTDISKSLDQQ